MGCLAVSPGPGRGGAGGRGGPLHTPQALTPPPPTHSPPRLLPPPPPLVQPPPPPPGGRGGVTWPMNNKKSIRNHRRQRRRRKILVGCTRIQVTVLWCLSPPGVEGTVVPGEGGGARHGGGGKNLDFLFVKNRPPTANRQPPPTATNRQPLSGPVSVVLYRAPVLTMQQRASP